MKRLDPAGFEVLEVRQLVIDVLRRGDVRVVTDPGAEERLALGTDDPDVGDLRRRVAERRALLERGVDRSTSPPPLTDRPLSKSYCSKRSRRPGAATPGASFSISCVSNQRRAPRRLPAHGHSIHPVSARAARSTGSRSRPAHDLGVPDLDLDARLDPHDVAPLFRVRARRPDSAGRACHDRVDDSASDTPLDAAAAAAWRLPLAPSAD